MERANGGQRRKKLETFSTKHTRDWHGLWTRYEPGGQVLQTFQSLRKFSVDDTKKDLIHQYNRYQHPDGKVEEKSGITLGAAVAFPAAFLHSLVGIIGFLFSTLEMGC